jgi:L-iditol 2-dehydrogenase
MLVARLHAPHDVRLHDEAVPEPQADEILVRVAAVGLCGSDRRWFEEGGIGDARLGRPLVLGHEFAGTVASGPRIGERVAVDPANACGTCVVCSRGQLHLCPDMQFAGHGATDGALRAFIAWPGRLCHPLPDSIPDPEAALLEPLGVALHALDLSHPERLASAGVFGCGPIGLLLVQLLRSRGVSRIVATDRLAHRVAAARSMGATEAWLVQDDSPGELDLDAVFEVAGEADAVEDAVRSVGFGGRVVLVGIPADDRTSFTASVARRKGLTILVSRRMQPSGLPRAIELARNVDVDLGSLVSDRFRLVDVSSALVALAAQRSLKVVVEPQADWDDGPRTRRMVDQ